VVGAGGLLLLISLFLPWYGVDVTVEGLGGVSVEGEGLSGWTTLELLDLYLAAVALLAIVWEVGRLARGPRPPVAVLAVAAPLAALLIVFRLLDPPDVDVIVAGEPSEIGRRIGIFFALLATALMSLGTWRAGREEPVAASS
jgi:hypothetical protein